MLTKWRSLVVTGVMLSALVLFGTTTALAQAPAAPKPTVTAVAGDPTKLSVTFSLPENFKGKDSAAATDLSDIAITGFGVIWYKGSSANANPAGSSGATEVTRRAADSATEIYDITGLTAGTEYAVAVRMYHGTAFTRATPGVEISSPGLYGPTTAQRTEYAAAMKPAKPALTATGYDSIRARLTPNAAADGVTGYSLFYRAGSTVAISDTDAKRMELGKDVVDVDLTDLMPETEYAVAVLATNPKGSTALSDVATISTLAAPTPDRVPQPTLTNEGDGSLTLDWSAPAAGGTGITIVRYMVQFQEMGDASWLDWNPSPTTSEVTLTGLTNGKTYRVQVKAVNSVGGVSEDWSIATSGTPMEPTAPPPPPPAELAAPTGVMAAAGDGMIEVSWNAVDGADSYEVSWMSAGGGATSTDTTMETSYTIENVMNGTEYSVQVSSMKGDMKSTASTAVTAMPAAAPLDAPMNVMATGGDGMIMVAWDAVDRADSYTVSWNAGGGPITSDTAMGTSYTIENLMNGTEYSVTVSAMMGDMEGPASEAAMATPMPATDVPALPLFGMLALGAGLVAAGRRRLRAQRLLKN